MSQNVERLKELLFDHETQTLARLVQRVDDISDLSGRIESLADLDARGRQELKDRIEDLVLRVGDSERLAASVAEVIADVLRRAEVANHTELAQSVAPLVVSTIKTELRNSQDELVEALYPITGRLVKAYVASAVKDLADQMNRRLEQNRFMLRLQSIATGRSVGELALAATQDFEVREVYLIRRGTGELLAHWPQASADGRDHAVSGVLAAINEFANDAFAADQSALRQIDLGEEDIYLRASPLYLLAARCSGTAPKSLEGIIDDAFLAAIEEHYGQDHKNGGSEEASQSASTSALRHIGENLQQRIATEKAQLRRPASFGALKFLVALIVLPLLTWMGISWYSDFANARLKERAARIVNAVPQMAGYPTQLDVSHYGGRVVISGLAPSDEIKLLLNRRLNNELRGVDVSDRMSVVSGNAPVPDLTPQFAKVRSDLAQLASEAERASALRAADRALVRLRQAQADLGRAEATGSMLAQKSEAIAPLLSDTEKLRATIAAAKATSNARQGILDLARRVRDSADALVPAGVAATAHTPESGEAPGSSLSEAMEQLASETERLGALAGAASFAAASRPSAAERLRTWTRSKAVFFANDADYLDAADVNRTLKELAPMVSAAGLRVRVVGYTDESGVQSDNITLAQKRSARVIQDLVNLGVDGKLLLSVGRSNARDLSNVIGRGSANRRVEFEVGFDGEPAP
jgi:outer membrane protein OmpA-like peptidoglycan-associated protein